MTTLADKTKAKRENARRYYLKNRERILSKCHEYYAENKKEILAKQRAAYSEHPETKKQSSASYRAKNVDMCRASNRKSWMKNRARNLYVKKLWYADNKEHVAQKSKEWAHNNPQKRKETAKRFSKKCRDGLAGYYLRGLICQNTTLIPSDIPQGLVEVKRLLIQARRIIHDNV